MNAEPALREAYREWRRLAVAEGDAIRARNWGLVSDCQQALRQLQTRITELNNSTRNEFHPAMPPSLERKQPLGTIVMQLIEIGRRNQARLKEVRETARREAAAREQTARNLRRLQRSYGAPRPPAWTTVS
jgi:hypothetical protein